MDVRNNLLHLLKNCENSEMIIKNMTTAHEEQMKKENAVWKVNVYDDEFDYMPIKTYYADEKSLGNIIFNQVERGTRFDIVPINPL